MPIDAKAKLANLKTHTLSGVLAVVLGLPLCVFFFSILWILAAPMTFLLPIWLVWMAFKERN